MRLNLLLTEALRGSVDSPAVLCDGQVFKGGDLLLRSQRLADQLVDMNLSGGLPPVAISVHPGPKLLVALLASLIRGAAPCILNPAAPRTLWAAALHQIGAKTLIQDPVAGKRFGGLVEESGLTVLNLDEDNEDLCISHRLSTLHPQAQDLESIAIVCLTSGSSGRPKAVAIPHRALVAHIQAMREVLGPGHRSLLVSNPSYSLAWTPLFVPLATGGSVTFLPERALIEPRIVSETISNADVSLIKCTPSFLGLLLRTCQDHGLPLPQRLTIVISGEVVQEAMLRKWLELFPSHRLLVTYGMTEAHSMTVRHVDLETIGGVGDPVNVGRPLRHFQMTVSDHTRVRSRDLGDVGMIHVDGTGVFAGYLEEGQLIPHTGAFPTGDLGSFHSSGDLFLIGRADRMLKVRGQRLYPEHVETLLARLPGIRQASVHLSDGRLMALVEGILNNPNTLREQLREHLYPHEIPSEFGLVDESLVASGKVDHATAARLLKSKLGSSVSEAPFAPSSGLLERVCALLSGVLGRTSIDPSKTLDALGFDSLSIIEATLALEDMFSMRLPSMGPWTTPHSLTKAISEPQPSLEHHRSMPKLTVLTIEADLSEIVEGRHWMPAVVASRIDGRSHPLTSSQKNRRRRKGGGSSDFTYVRLKFSDPVDTLALGNALSDIVSRHEALFSIFGSDERIPVTPLGTAFVPVIDVPTNSITEWTDSILQQFHRPYYLAHWPLFRWVLLRERTGSLFLWQISHMVVDLPGVDILEREIAIAYEARICGESPSLPTVPYVTDDYVADLAALTYHPSVLSQLDSDLRQYNDAVGICKEILSTRRDFGAHVGHLLPDVYPDRIDPYAIIAAMATAVGVWLSIDIVPVRIGTTGRTYRALPCDYARLVSQANDHYLIPADVSSRLVGRSAHPCGD